MNRYLAGCVGAAVVMVALDMLWLGVIAKSFYQQSIGHLMAEKPNVTAAVVFYALYAVGLFAYATYDLSNLATLKNWPVSLTLADIVWGTVLSAASAGIGKAAMNWAARA